jgi:predicted PurR-regulated permease PerM
MQRTASTQQWQHALIVLSGVTVAAIATAALYWAQKVLIPVALAIFIAFLLAPLVMRLQQRGLGRVPSVVLVVALAALLVVFLGWIFTRQIGDLAEEMPQYTKNITHRIRFLRDIEKDSVFKRLREMAEEVASVWNEPGQPAPPAPNPPEAKDTLRVQIDSGSSWLGNIVSSIPSAFEFLASGALTIALVVFMLLWREDMRNRVIWITGRRRVALATKALDDISERISRYLLTQLLINSCYGVALAAGLYLIGIDHPLLWGLLAGLLRYLPYIGAPIAALFPIALSLAQFVGWTQPLLVIGLIVLLEVITANAVEPLLFGKSIGVSAVALLVSAGFWTFLWGPIGLLLSGPLTVCVVVVGEYVPSLRFLAVLLGDRPALEPEISLFQRLTAGDQDEAFRMVLAYVKDHPPEQVYDDMLLPALARVRTARSEETLDEEDERFILEAMRVTLDELAPLTPATNNEPQPSELDRPRVRILGCPARDEFDQLTLQMLAHLLDPTRWDLHVVPETLLAGELISLVRNRQPAVVCIGSLPPGGAAHVRYLCKRLRGSFPDLRLLVGRWMEASPANSEGGPMDDLGADKVDATLLQARNQLLTWLPVLETQEVNGRPAVAPESHAVATGV